MIRNVLTTSSHSNTQPCVFTHADNPWLSSSVKTNRFNSSAGLDAWPITGEEISLLFPPAPLQQLPVQGCSSHQAPPHILYLWEEHLQQLDNLQPQRRVSGKAQTCLAMLAGLLFTPKEPLPSWDSPVSAKLTHRAEISAWRGGNIGRFFKLVILKVEISFYSQLVTVETHLQ